MMLHLVRLAVDNIRNRRTRSWLTILGVLIGVTAVVSLLSIGMGVEDAVLQQFKDIGYDIIVITQGGAGRAFGGANGRPGFGMQEDAPPGASGATVTTRAGTFTPGQVGQATSGSPSTGSTSRTFDPNQLGVPAAAGTTRSTQQQAQATAVVDTAALLKDVSGLLQAGNLGTRIVSVEGRSASGFLRMVTPSLGFMNSFPSVLSGFKIQAGTTFTDTTRNEVVIGARSANSLGVGVGDSLTIDGDSFKVVGILASSRSPSEASAVTSARNRTGTNEVAQVAEGIGNGASFLTRGMTNTDDSLFVLEERATVLWPSADANATTIVRMATGVTVSTVLTDISTELTKQGVRATPVSVQQIAGSIQGTLSMIETVLASIAAVALIVGGVGLMNTMYTSVLERTREIGILKAVGARDGQVMVLFLIDSGLMGLIGGILGLVLGGVLSVFGTRLLGPALGVGSFQPVLTAPLILSVLAASFVIGALSGAWPAWRASRLNPVEALASE